MTGLPISSAMALALLGGVGHPARRGGHVVLGEQLFRAWYSKRSMDSLSLCVDFEGLRPTGSGELYPHD